MARYGASIVGGAERLTQLLAHALRDRGWEVTVVTTRATDERTWADALPAGRSVEEGIRVERHGVRMRRHHDGFRELSRAFWRLPPAVRPEAAWLTLQGPWSPSLESSLRARPELPTIFISYLYRPTIWGVPAVVGPRLLLPTAHDEMPLRLRSVARMLDRIDAIWYATPEERDIVERAHPAAASRPSESGNVAVEAPDGIDPRRFLTERGITGPYLLYGGRATQGKGLVELLEGVRRLRVTHPDAMVVLTGEAGQLTPEEPGVVPVGTLDDRARWDAIGGAAAVVVPSFHESLSLLALEAWAAGRPALLNGASPVLAGQAQRSGGGVVYEGAAGLAQTAAGLLDEPAAADALGAAGREHVVSAYTWTAVVARLERLLAVAAEPADRRLRAAASIPQGRAR